MPNFPIENAKGATLKITHVTDRHCVDKRYKWIALGKNETLSLHYFWTLKPKKKIIYLLILLRVDISQLFIIPDKLPFIHKCH